jgi:iron complex outermembrane receptor protein
MVGNFARSISSFPGFKPVNAVDKGRNSAVYADLEYDVTEKWLLNGALRYRIILILEELQTIKLLVTS